MKRLSKKVKKMTLFITTMVKKDREGNPKAIRKIVNLPGTIANDIVDCFGITNVILGTSEGSNSDGYYIELLSKEMSIEFKKDKIDIIHCNGETYSIKIVNPYQEIEEDD